MFTVKWETLNGNIRTKRISDPVEADKFADNVAERLGTQWVDVEQTDD